jgi:hypothetical protein
VDIPVEALKSQSVSFSCPQRGSHSCVRRYRANGMDGRERKDIELGNAVINGV